jgi:hypothetical protein
MERNQLAMRVIESNRAGEVCSGFAPEGRWSFGGVSVIRRDLGKVWYKPAIASALPGEALEVAQQVLCI